MNISLRSVTPRDLDALFEFQRDPVAIHMAAFTSEDPHDRAAFDAHWARVLADDTVVMRAIDVDTTLVGSVLIYVSELGPEASYWIDREHWGKGIATAALGALLTDYPTRPVHARVAKDNGASIRVLGRCGFVVVRDDSGHASGRGEVTEEWVMRLDGPTERP